MGWDSIITILPAILIAIGLPLALRKRKKGGPAKKGGLHQHLQGIGMQVSLVEEGTEDEKIGKRRSLGEKSQGLIEVKGRNIDWINVIGVSSQYGTNYFIDYLVTSMHPTTTAEKKTKLTRKKSQPLRGKVIDIGWKGDSPLAQRLNYDYGLKDKILYSDFKGSIDINPEPKLGYTRIRTDYALPSLDLLETIEIIAKHIKSG